MVLEKPPNEECGNCKFCISLEKKNVEGIFNIIESTVEIFFCRREPPQTFYANLSSQCGYIISSAHGNDVPKTHWCGEWKERK
jgi:hypothetical protein